jgi:hypothetical protein
VKKFILTLILVLFTVQSQAGFICHRSQATKIRAELFGPSDFLDNLNQRHNGFVFDKSLTDMMLDGADGLEGFDRIRQKWKIRKLRQKLEAFEEHQNWDRGDLLDLARKLENISYLTDREAQKGLSYSEKTFLRDVKRSILFHGLEKYFAADLVDSRSRIGKVWRVLKAILFPSIQRPVTPEDIAMKIAWEGIERNQNLYNQYVVLVHGKTGVNLLLRAWTVYLSMTMAIIPFSRASWEAYERAQIGKQQAIDQLTQMKDQSAKLADKEQIQKRLQARHLEISIQNYKQDYGEEPQGLDLELLVAISRNDQAEILRISRLIDQK